MPLRNGRASGEAVVEFDSEENYQTALKKDKQHIGKRWGYGQVICHSYINTSTEHSIIFYSSYIDVFPEGSKPTPRSHEGGRGDRGSFGSRSGDRHGDGGFRRQSQYTGSSAWRRGEAAVRIRGLPFQVNSREVYDFFSPLPICRVS